MQASRLRSTILALGICTLPSTGFAEQTLEEIRVYATLDQRTLSEHVGSLSLVDADDIATRNAQHIDQLLALSPNTHFSGGAARGRFVQIRGIGDIEQFVDPKPYPAVGLMVDGIELNGLFAAGLLFDSEQVEILRGPQGTRLGASSLAGAINIVSTAPTQSTEAFVEAGAGNLSSWQAGGAVGGALADTLSGRLAVQQYRSDGYIENGFLNRDDTGQFDELSLRGKLRWQLPGEASLDLTVLHSDSDNGYDAFSLDNRHNETFSDEPGHDRVEVDAIALQYRQPVGENTRLDVKLTALQADQDYAFDEDWVDANFCDSQPCDPMNFFSSFDRYQRDRDEYVADIRLVNPLFVAGIYAQQRQSDLLRNSAVVSGFESEYDSERYAIYGQWTPRLDDQLTATLGLRLEHFSDDYIDNAGLRDESADDLWSFEAGLDWTLSDRHSAQLLVARGNKPGGVNTNSTSNIPTIVSPILEAELRQYVQYDSESLTNIEIGHRYTSADQRLALQGTVFYNHRNNPQFETFLLEFVTEFVFTGYQANAGEAESAGVELDLSYQLTSFIEVLARAGYIESSFRGARVFDFDEGALVNLASIDQPRSPKYQYHLAINYQANEDWLATLSVDGRDGYRYAYYFDERADDNHLLHFALQYRGEQLSAQLWVRNLLDEEYPVQGLYFANDPRDGAFGYEVNRLYTQAGEPRRAGITLRYDL